jgi:hypothetical protein
VNLKKATIGELLALSRQVLVELRQRDVIRTTNAPTGDYAEWLVWRVVKGALEPNSKRSWDLVTTWSGSGPLGALGLPLWASVIFSAQHGSPDGLEAAVHYELERFGLTDRFEAWP